MLTNARSYHHIQRLARWAAELSIKARGHAAACTLAAEPYSVCVVAAENVAWLRVLAERVATDESIRPRWGLSTLDQMRVVAEQCYIIARDAEKQAHQATKELKVSVAERSAS